jgi:hypothetical protein
MSNMVSNYKDLIKKLHHIPFVLWAIPSDEFLHPCVTDVSAVFIKELVDGEVYCVSFNHPDLSPVVDKKTFINDLNEVHDGKRKWVFDKKSFIQLLPVKNLLDIDLLTHLQKGYIKDKSIMETTAHKFIYRTKRECGDLNKVVPLLKHKEVFEKMCKGIIGTDMNILDEGYEKENEVIIETLAELESNGIYVNADCFSKHFNAKIQPNGLVYSKYNVYTSTGRPSNHFDGVNYAALNKEDGSRSCFVSRYGNDGKMVLIDYSAFHPRIICRVTHFPMDINEDIYKYLGEMYFQRKVTEYDMDEIKSITMRQLYGGVEPKYEHIKYFGNLKEFINIHWEKFKKDGFTWTPVFRRIITDNHLKDANPAKLFNYILQATETEIALSAVRVVNEYLRDKKTKAMLYTYDSLLFDFYKGDGQTVLNDIMEIMMMCKRFPIKVYSGESYNSMVQIYP